MMLNAKMLSIDFIFMKLKKTFLSRRKGFFFFRGRSSVNTIACPNRGKRGVKRALLPDLVSGCQCNRRMISRRKSEYEHLLQTRGLSMRKMVSKRMR
jgi:hypothetical protein